MQLRSLLRLLPISRSALDVETKDVVCFHAANFYHLAFRLQLDLHEPPMSQVCACVRVYVHDCVHGCMRVFEYEKLYSEGTYVRTYVCTVHVRVHSVCSTVVVQQWLVCTVIKLQQISRNPCT